MGCGEIKQITEVRNAERVCNCKSWSEKGLIEIMKLEQWLEPLWEWDVQIYGQTAFQTEEKGSTNTCEMLPGVFNHQQRNQSCCSRVSKQKRKYTANGDWVTWSLVKSWWGSLFEMGRSWLGLSRKLTVRNCEGSELLLYLQINTSSCHSADWDSDHYYLQQNQ